MVRVITQETYDEVVKENIEEFEMTSDEAIREAIAQFEAQGVDLSNIIKDLALTSKDEHLVSTTVGNLKDISMQDTEGILRELNTLKIECNKDIAYRIRAAKENAYNILMHIIDACYNEDRSELKLAVLNTLVSLMDSQPDLLDQRGVDLIKRLLDEHARNEDILIATLKWVSVCCVKHELNRQLIFGKDIVKNLKPLLNEDTKEEVLSEVLQVLRKLTLDDDIRVEFGKAHEHAKEIAVYTLDDLTNLLKVKCEPPLVSEVMFTMASVLVRHELCQRVADAGGAVALFAVLADNYENVAVVTQALKLITALAGSDDVKRLLIKNGMATLIVSMLQRHASNEIAAALSLKCIAALTLREPTHSLEFGENGAPEAIVQAMKIHPTVAAVQKNACWAIRNIVARCRNLNAKFHELGAESALNDAYKRFAKDFGFDIRSALRDLECNVKLEEQWTGSGVQIRND